MIPKNSKKTKIQTQILPTIGGYTPSCRKKKKIQKITKFPQPKVRNPKQKISISLQDPIVTENPKNGKNGKNYSPSFHMDLNRNILNKKHDFFDDCDPDLIRGFGPICQSPVKSLEVVKNFDVETLFTNWQRAVQNYGPRQCLGTKNENHKSGSQNESNGAYVWQTYDQLNTRIKNFGSGLCTRLKLKKYTKIGIYSENRTEWVIAEQACNGFGFINVPLYEPGGNFVSYVLKHSEIQVLISSRQKTLQILNLLKKKNLENGNSNLWCIVQMEAPKNKEATLAEELNIKLIPFDWIEKHGKKNMVDFVTPCSLDTASIFYDIRANGDIKGVVLSHQNIISSAKNLFSLQPDISASDIHFSYFPLANVLERSILTLVFYSGGSVGFFKGDKHKFFDGMRTLRPTILYGVPPIFSRLYRNYKILMSSKSYLAQSLFQKVYAYKKQCIKNGQQSLLWDKLIFKQFSRELGGRVRLIFVASNGQFPKKHKQFLKICFCVPVIKIYLKTEFGVCAGGTGAHGYPAATNDIRLYDIIGSPGFSSKTEPECGEIAVRGPNVFKEYYKDPELTQSRLVDGWFFTTEIGRWNGNGAGCGTLSVLGHKEDLLEPIKGCSVFASNLECTYIESPFVRQIWITNLRFRPLVAIIVPDEEALMQWAKNKKEIPNDEIFWNDTKRLCSDERIISTVQRSLNHVAQNANLKTYDCIKALYLTCTPFNLKSCEITPTLELRRDQLKINYQNVVNKLYKSIGIQISNLCHQNLSKSCEIPSPTSEEFKEYEEYEKHDFSKKNWEYSGEVEYADPYGLDLFVQNQQQDIQQQNQQKENDDEEEDLERWLENSEMNIRLLC